MHICMFCPGVVKFGNVESLDEHLMKTHRVNYIISSAPSKQSRHAKEPAKSKSTGESLPQVSNDGRSHNAVSVDRAQDVGCRLKKSKKANRLNLNDKSKQLPKNSQKGNHGGKGRNRTKEATSTKDIKSSGSGKRVSDSEVKRRKCANEDRGDKVRRSHQSAEPISEMDGRQKPGRLSMYSCIFCDEIFNHIQHLTGHLHESHKISDDFYKVKLVKMGVNQRLSVNKKQLQFDYKQAENNCCSVCKKWFPNRRSLRLHKRSHQVD